MHDEHVSTSRVYICMRGEHVICVHMPAWRVRHTCTYACVKSTSHAYTCMRGEHITCVHMHAWRARHMCTYACVESTWPHRTCLHRAHMHAHACSERTARVDNTCMSKAAPRASTTCMPAQTVLPAFLQSVSGAWAFA